MRRVHGFLAALVLLASAAYATTYHVAPDGSGDFPTIQAALDAAQDGDIIELTGETFAGDGNRDLDFQGKAVTVRSRFDEPVTCFLDCAGSASEPHRGVVFDDGEGPASVLSGITILNGWAESDPYGAAVLCRGGSSPTIENCIFVRNSGSALAIDDGSNPTITACNFRWNESEQGGAVRIRSSHPVFSGCTFEENAADWGGGAVIAAGSAGEFTGCTFRRNSSDRGGAVSLEFSGEFTFTDCAFFGNDAAAHGALLVWFTTARLTRCTFARNQALHSGSAIGSGKMAYTHLSYCTFYGNVAGEATLALGERQSWLDHCIIAFNLGAPACWDSGDITLSCCDLFGNEGGDWVGQIAEQYGQAGNICLDPLFCDAEKLDFTLADASPCAAGPACGLIGAWPVGCGGIAVEATTWGAVKAGFR